MRLDFGETWGEKQARLSIWHKWFAWYPVKISPHDWRWLERVERKLMFTRSGNRYSWYKEYR